MPTVYFLPQTHLLGKSDRGTLCLKRRESLNSCLFSTKPWSTRGTAASHELAPLSLNWLTDRSRSEGGVESTLSILDFIDADFKTWCCLFNSVCRILACYHKRALCGNRIYVRCCYRTVDEANCCGAADRKPSGTPSAPWEGVKVTSWSRLLGRVSVWPNSVGRTSFVKAV